MQIKHARRKDPLPANLSALALQLKVLADPTRLTILELLMKGLQCNCVLGDHLGLPMNLISHHLKILRRAGLVTVSRDTGDARWIYYAVNAIKIAKMHDVLSAFLNPDKIMERLPLCGPQEVRASSLRAVAQRFSLKKGGRNTMNRFKGE